MCYGQVTFGISSFNIDKINTRSNSLSYSGFSSTYYLIQRTHGLTQPVKLYVDFWLNNYSYLSGFYDRMLRSVLKTKFIPDIDLNLFKYCNIAGAFAFSTATSPR